MAESIKDKVAIVGMGCTKFGELWDKSVTDLIVDAAYEAYEDVGVEPNDIQAAWVGTVFGFSGQAGGPPPGDERGDESQAEKRSRSGGGLARGAGTDGQTL